MCQYPLNHHSDIIDSHSSHNKHLPHESYQPARINIILPAIWYKHYEIEIMLANDMKVVYLLSENLQLPLGDGLVT